MTLETPPRRDWVLRAPPIVIGLLVIMSVVAALMAFAPPRFAATLFFHASLIPARFAVAGEYGLGPAQLFLPLISHQFLHGNALHLFMNMMFLLAFGTPVATRMASQTICSGYGPPAGLAETRPSVRGGFVFLAFFLLSGIFSGLVFVAANWAAPIPAVGASGAISGLMAAAIRIAVPAVGYRGIDFNAGILPISHPRVVQFSLAIVWLNFAIGFLGNFLMPNGAQIAWEAHIGGYLFGLFALPLSDRLAR